jgi:hypothetical protein
MAATAYRDGSYAQATFDPVAPVGTFNLQRAVRLFSEQPRANPSEISEIDPKEVGFRRLCQILN